MTQISAPTQNTPDNARNAQDFLCVIIAGQSFGIPILQIQDVLREQAITKVPLAPEEIAGALNLRGRIVTAIDVRRRLQMNGHADQLETMSVVVEHDNELFSLIIDDVGDVMALDPDYFEKNPATLDAVWRDISTGIYRLEDKLLVILDIPKLIETVNISAPHAA